MKVFAPTIIQKDGQNLLEPKGQNRGVNQLIADPLQGTGAPKVGLFSGTRSQNSSGGNHNTL